MTYNVNGLATIDLFMIRNIDDDFLQENAHQFHVEIHCHCHIPSSLFVFGGSLKVIYGDML